MNKLDLRCVYSGWMQGERRGEWSFHSQAPQRRRHTNTQQPFGLGLVGVQPQRKSNLFINEP